MPKTEKRRSLCIEALNAPSVFLGSTWTGWLLGVPSAYLSWKLIDYKAAIIIGGFLWQAPRLISQTSPYLVTALLHNLFFGEFYDAN